MTRILVLLGFAVSTAAFAAAPPIWDQWYTVTGPGGSHLSYFHERFEDRGEKYVYEVESWNQAGESVRRERVEAAARASLALDPISFSYEGPNGKSKGAVVQGRRMNVTHQEAGRPAREARATLPSRAVLAPFLPVWLGQKGKLAKPGRSISMISIPLAGGPGLRVRTVQVRFQTRDERAIQLKAGRLEVIRTEGSETWWVDTQGLPIRIERASDQAVIERADEAKARSFLERRT